MTYRKLNIYLGWTVFLIATIVYFITIEDTASLWDCGEYITAAYKLEVGHPPGAPLFMVLGRLFSFFAAPENVAIWINRMSALSSSLTILFMFWSITALLRKMALDGKELVSKGETWAILGAAAVGSLAYTFSDTFWFSAVEGEVYAMASLFTAVIFWAILKWDEEVAQVQNGMLSVEYSPNRWLLLIMFLIGLAIGVHLLGILLVPAIGYVIYFRLKEKVTFTGWFLAGIISIVVLGFIQVGVIPGIVSLASNFEVSFRNSLGLPFYSGTIFFFLLLVGGLIYAIRYTRKKNKIVFNNALMGLAFLLIGYGSFAIIVIRSNANTPLDENDPENLVTLRSYLLREQYGSAPILYGQYWNSNMDENRETWGDRSAFHLRRFVVKKNDQFMKAFKSEADAQAFVKENGGEYEEVYHETNADYRLNANPAFVENTIFPRMWSGDDPNKVNGYKKWSGYDPTSGNGKGSDGGPIPTFGDNLRFFFKYQMNWMYVRYFMWNFAGRQNDIQGHGDHMRGNWISGFSSVDDARLGNQANAPYYTTNNPANNTYFFLPLILGLLGVYYHFRKAPKDAFVVLLGFIFAGLAILVYLNPRAFEPRERDYAFAGSFYFFAIWIAVGVYALFKAYQGFDKEEWKKLLFSYLGFLLLMAIFDLYAATGLPNLLSGLIIGGIGFGLLGLFHFIGKSVKNESMGAVSISTLTLLVPVLMAFQGWDDHDRSNKTSAHDLAFNYLTSCGKNGIIFTNGDNDTFPLWYMQEVEGFRTDVRVCNLSLMQTDWYTDQMKMRAYDSDPLPIKFREDQILMYLGGTDQVSFLPMVNMFMNGVKPETIEKIIEMRYKANPTEAKAAIQRFVANAGNSLGMATSSNPRIQARLTQLKSTLTTYPTANYAQDIVAKYNGLIELYGAIQSRSINIPNEAVDAFNTLLSDFEKGWEGIYLKDAMEFVRDDNNMLISEGRSYRFFPSSSFVLPVNTANAVKSGIITQDEAKVCKDRIAFTISGSGLSREEVMMLDVIANNEWKRGIYFSSPGGSEVSKALFRGRAIKQNGMNFELSPLRDPNQINERAMYANLMKNYKYGDMANPEVLTDYYARRHTSQYRLHFSTLAEYYINQIYKAEDAKEKGMPAIEYLKNSGRTDEAAEYEYLLNNFDKVVADAKKKGVEVLKRSLELMPANIVLDNGEPNPGQATFNTGGVQLPSYSDGILADYVEMFYMLGDKKAAGELAEEMATQYESVLNYFATSHPVFILDVDNQKDLYAALNDYFKLTVAANDPEHDPQGAFAKRSQKFVSSWYKTELPKIYDRISTYAEGNGESLRSSSGTISSQYQRLKNYMDAIGMEYGIVPRPQELPMQPEMPAPQGVLPEMVNP